MSNLIARCTAVFLLSAAFVGAPAAFAANPPPKSADPLESSLIGEFALQSGKLKEAAKQYLEAAEAAQDPVLAERSARIALLADADDLAWRAWRVWTRLAPQPTRDSRMIEASLELRAGQKRAAKRTLRALLAEEGGWRQALTALVGAVGKQQTLVTSVMTGIVEADALPNELQAWLGFGGLAQRLEQPALVDKIVKKVVAHFPGEPRVVLLRAQLLREAGKRDAAKKVLVSIEGEAQKISALRWAVAGEYDALGEPQKAAQILAQGPQDDASYAQRAGLLDKANDQAGLVALYEELRGSATEPNPMRRLLLGQLAEQLKHYSEALAWYASAPGTRAQGVGRMRTANVRWLMGEKTQAYNGLHEAQSDPLLDDDARRDSYLLEAELRQKDGDYVGEQDAYARGLATFADNQDLLYARALMWERHDDIAKAEADFRRILVISPDSVVTLNALGYTLADRTNRYREALELIDRARVAEPGNGAIIDSYGWVLFRLGKTREALAHLRHAYALQKDPDIASHLGQVLWVLGQKQEARKYFEEARRLDPSNRSLQRALQETGA